MKNTITYKVYSIRYRMDLGTHNAFEIFKYCLKEKIKVDELMNTITCLEKPVPRITDSELIKLLGIDDQTEKEFSNGTAIENRREAIRFAQRQCSIAHATNLYSDPTDVYQVLKIYGLDFFKGGLDRTLRAFNAVVVALVEGRELVVTRLLEADKEMVNDLICEYKEYKKYGFDIGGKRPFTPIHRDLKHQIELLPDVERTWR